MSSPVSVDPAQVRRIVDKARAFVDAFEQLREPAEAAGLMDWFEFHRRSIQRQWDELRGVVVACGRPPVPARGGRDHRQRRSARAGSAWRLGRRGRTPALDALAGDRIELVRAVVGPDRYPTPEGYQQIESALRTIA